MSNWKTPQLKKLANVLASIKYEAEMLNFLRDLCTAEELIELAGRWEVAKLIAKGISYRDIAEKTGISTTTITRVAYWIKHGEGGYKKVLERN
jgi:TrpR-related protein YerC/YecD